MQPILEAANAVISHNKLRNPKNLWSTRNATNRILSITCSGGDQEAEVAATVVQLVKQHTSLRNVAVLYRTHYQSRTLEEALIHKAIPYKIIGGIRFYERKEVKDLLAYLRLIVNPFDKISLLRVINTPSRGLGEKFEEELLRQWITQPLLDFKQMLGLMAETLPPAKKRTVQEFLTLYEQVSIEQSPSITLDTIINTIEYRTYLNATYDPQEAQAKIENVQELIQALVNVEVKYQTQPSTGTLLESFLHEVALLQDVGDGTDQTDCILMMTLHAAKGLEFDTVIMSGLEEGLLPSQKSLNAHEDLEEERRLMYVGMTRAKERLILLHASTRYTYGQLTDQAPSRFLGELPAGLVHELDLAQIPRFQMRSQLEYWITGRVGVAPTTTYVTTGAKKSVFTPVFKPSVAHHAMPWYKNQSVMHQKFGTGIVTEVEKAPDDDFYVTALFKSGKKKILGKFLNPS